jgi:MFS family permease
VLAAAFLSAPIISAFGWRGLFVVGAFPAIIALVLRKKLQESPKFLQRQAQTAENNLAPVSSVRSLRMLVADKETVGISIGMLVLNSVQNFGYYGIMIGRRPKRSASRPNSSAPSGRAASVRNNA